MAPQILVFGLPRTGTQSLLDALELLGFSRTYHMRNVQKCGHRDEWIALIDQKYSHDFSGVDLDRLKELIDGYDAIADFPAAIFAPELMQLFPEARVILTPRDEDAWIKSVSDTLVWSHTKPDADKARPLRLLTEKYHTYCWHDDFTNYGRPFYRNYLQEVRRLGQGRQMLEYTVKEGWVPLCNFLDLPAPEEPFPRNDELGAYRRPAVDS